MNWALGNIPGFCGFHQLSVLLVLQVSPVVFCFPVLLSKHPTHTFPHPSTACTHHAHQRDLEHRHRQRQRQQQRQQRRQHQLTPLTHSKHPTSLNNQHGSAAQARHAGLSHSGRAAPAGQPAHRAGAGQQRRQHRGGVCTCVFVSVCVTVAAETLQLHLAVVYSSLRPSSFCGVPSTPPTNTNDKHKPTTYRFSTQTAPPRCA